MNKYYEIHAQGTNIRCKVYYEEKCSADKAVIFGTGFAGHKDNNAAKQFSEKLLAKDKNALVVVFNWPAHGDDIKKKLVLNDCSIYLEQVIRETKERFGAERLFSYATSFGGYLVLKYISEHGNPFRKIALRCPAVNMYEVLTGTIMKQDEYDRTRKGEEVPVGFDRKIMVTRAFLEDLKSNDIRKRDYISFADDILILHGTADEVVPFSEGEAFAENQLIGFIPVEGADHRFQNPAHMSLATKKVLKFFGY